MILLRSDDGPVVKRWRSDLISNKVALDPASMVGEEWKGVEHTINLVCAMQLRGFGLCAMGNLGGSRQSGCRCFLFFLFALFFGSGWLLMMT